MTNGRERLQPGDKGQRHDSRPRRDGARCHHGTAMSLNFKPHTATAHHPGIEPRPHPHRWLSTALTATTELRQNGAAHDHSLCLASLLSAASLRLFHGAGRIIICFFLLLGHVPLYESSLSVHTFSCQQTGCVQLVAIRVSGFSG